MRKWKFLSASAVLGSALLLGACNEDVDNSSASTEDDATTESLSGNVSGDGSSTVSPIIEAIVEDYSGVQPDVRVSVGVSGTGGGFEKFINNETDFSNASRLIKDEEATALQDAGIDYTQLEIAYDGLTVVINPENDWAGTLSVEQLQKLWTEDGTVKKWSDIDPSWPEEEVVFYSPGADSGTYDYFDDEILDGEDIVSSASLSEDDNVLVQGVAADKYAIAYFGYSYYVANEDKLQAVAVDGIAPSTETIESGEYTPLSRSLYIYVKNSSVTGNPAVKDFLTYTLENVSEMAELTGYVKLPDEKLDVVKKQLEAIK